MLTIFTADTYTSENVLDPESIKARTRAGFNWARETHPDRLARVNVDDLDISLGSKCVGGQMYSDFGEFHWAEFTFRNLTPVQHYEMGFLPGFDGWSDKTESFNQLDGLWHEEAAALTESWQALLRGLATE